MMRNDYRRALILLRGNAPGYSGHVRLERRTLMGSMYFLLQAPPQCQTLRAALVGRNRDGYYACALGEMTRDARGQAVMSYSFDPRNICGRELEQYQLIVVTCAGMEDCEIVLYGNVCGHADLNWERVRTALCGLYSDVIARDVQDLPAPEEEERAKAEITEERQEETEEETRELQEELAEEVEEFQEKLEGELKEPRQDDGNRTRTAGELLEIDMDLPWPESVEALRPLFRLSVPMENPPDEEYTYIAVAMPPESGYPHCAVGALAENGAPVSVRYGLPAQWTAEPPAGLEEYAWVGNQNRGWWMTQVDLYGIPTA